MRLGLIGDTPGYVPALEAAIAGCRHAGVDLILHCGDFLSSPFSPDPPGETIALLRAEEITAPALQPGEIERVLSRPEVAGADLILCGHVPYPLVQRTPLPDGRSALVVRGVGWMRGEPHGRGWMVDYWILENVGPVSLGFSGWALHRHPRPFQPRDPQWTDHALRAGRVP